MAALDTRPETFDVAHYGGDTLTIEVETDFAFVTGKTWLAQVRSLRTSDAVDATFNVTPPAADGDKAYLVLPAAEVARLVSTAPVRKTTSRGVTTLLAQYAGEWDVEVSNNGSDPVTTLAQGSLTIDVDVSRAPA